MSGPVIVFDEAGGELDRNPSAEDLFGARPMADVLDDASWHRLLSAIQTAPQGAFPVTARSGEVYDATLRRAPAGVGVALYEVTRYVQVSDALGGGGRTLAELIEAIGVIDEASGVAAVAETCVRVIAGVLSAARVELEVESETYVWPVAQTSLAEERERAMVDETLVHILAPLECAGSRLGQVTIWRDRELEAPEQKVLEALCSHTAVTLDRARLVESAAGDASRDQLTGLFNRIGGLEAVRAVDGDYVVVLIDVDNLKLVNAEAGTDTGDEVLRKLARMLDRGRLGDVVVRWSGEEFLLVFPGSTLDGAAVRVRRILEEAEQTLWAGRRPVTFSCGIALVTDDGSLEEGLAQADRALFFAKKQGGGKVALANQV